MHSARIHLALNRRLMVAMATISLAAPGVVRNARPALAQSGEAWMEEMVVDNDVDTNANSETETQPAAPKPAADQPERKPSAAPTAPIKGMAPVQSPKRAGEETLISPPAQKTRTNDLRNRVLQTELMKQRYQRIRSSRPNQGPQADRLDQPATEASTMYPYSMYPAYQPNEDRTSARGAIPTYLPQRESRNDLFDVRRGDTYVGFTTVSPGRRPKYTHSRGPGRDFYNLRTDQNYYALPRHGGGQDLFDPHNGRVLYGIKRRDGNIDYYNPDTGQLILTQKRRRR